MSEVTQKDIKVFKYIQAKPSLANDQNALIAEIWESEDFWKHTSLLIALRSVTSADSIKRSHRALRENGWIEVDKKLLRKNMRLMNKVRDERSPANIHAIKKTTETLPNRVEIKGDTAYIVDKPNIAKEYQQNAATQLKEADQNKIADELFKPVQTSMFGDRNG